MLSLQRKQTMMRRPPRSLKRQQGVVIVIALFVVGLVATMSYVMLARLARDTERTAYITRNTQAALYAQGSIVWAMDQLRNDWLKQKPNRVVDEIPIKSPVNEVDGYKISSTIYDMQARFNINNLNGPDLQADIKRLLLTVDRSLPPEQINDLVLAITDWITPIETQTNYDRYYLALPTPYRSAHRYPMVSVAELQLVKGMTPARFNALRPYITALPETTPINIQTAPADVLMTLNPAMPLEAARELEVLRSKAPFVKVDQFMQTKIIKQYPVKAEKITTTSKYFLVETTVSIEHQRLLLYTLLLRKQNEGKATMRILWQSKGWW